MHAPSSRNDLPRRETERNEKEIKKNLLNRRRSPSSQKSQTFPRRIARSEPSTVASGSGLLRCDIRRPKTDMEIIVLG
ncbi:uncharacterized protein CLUP02_08570 [Colletotrichum lupini]|uniref:Uncharacterized protein n=1 Tax=Colletotrichum lupini TaxID=145971 RepID=A0A9Q8WH03_9PEZI|nr:uncharacterized protein CLUP02_08570 [Colletotrichum lupini]KAK1717603.1 hypothetical protein BDP67DRAFT_223813 [Colletotrichum lupini]UQC83079.1 hypothetical protein CLUP02_08570 [Colletotrichum lupini]